MVEMAFPVLGEFNIRYFISVHKLEAFHQIWMSRGDKKRKICRVQKRLRNPAIDVWEPNSLCLTKLHYVSKGDVQTCIAVNK